jgi:hypothetical protein
MLSEFEEIEGIDNEQDDVTPQGSTSVHTQRSPRPKKCKSPCKQVMLNSTSIGRCC